MWCMCDNSHGVLKSNGSDHGSTSTMITFLSIYYILKLLLVLEFLSALCCYCTKFGILIPDNYVL